MGEIKDGTVSGVLPEKEGFAVHYPGYPSSISRAVETLGGTEGILKARSSKLNSLELHFRPEDPHSHPAFGKIRPCCNLLLKISKKKLSDSHAGMVSENMLKSSTTSMRNLEPNTCYLKSVGTSRQNSGPANTMSDSNEGIESQIQAPAVPANLFADIVARVPEAYHYDGMVDYQHVLAVHADVSRKKKKHWADVVPKFEKGGLMDLDQEDLMILVPPLFSLKDVSENLVLRPLTALNSKKKQEAVVEKRWEMHIEPCLALDFNIDNKINWEENTQQGTAQWKGLVAVSKLFDERPVWPKSSLSERLRDENLKFGDHLLKRLLFKTAYYFSTGPFRRFYIRKGYDPRKDPESRIYQGIEFRLQPKFGDANPADELAHTWSDLCAFRVFPWKLQTTLQLSELVDDYIQQEIKKPPESTTCSCSTGWLSSNVIRSLRLRVAVRFLSICPKPGTEDLLKKTNELFEKSKRVHALKRDLKLDEEHLHVNKDSSTHEPSRDIPMEAGETELSFDDDVDVDVDEPDDEDNDGDGEIEGEEEELDEYDLLHLDGYDGDFSLQSTYPTGENISKNYLQELFGSFPSSGVGSSKAHDGEISDGEYKIFEEDSDDNDNYYDDDN